jgi:hypothetical protein
MTQGLAAEPVSFVVVALSMDPSAAAEQDLSVQQCEPLAQASEAGVRCRVLRGDGILGEFLLVRSDDGWMAVPVPGAVHEGLLHATAIDFARELNAGRLALD